KSPSIGRARSSEVPIEPGTSKFDLTLHVAEYDGRVLAQLEYNTDLFERVTIERIEKHFRRVLDSVVAHPERPIGELLILSEGEQRHLATWNTTEQAYASTAGIHELIEAQVERSPARVAAVFEQDSLTYRTLNGRANQLAHALRQRGVGQDTRVGLCVERSLDMVVALLAILKTGAAYVPLDPHYPAERTRFMLEDSEAR